MSYARCRNDVAACALVSAACMSSLPALVLCRGEDGGTASLCLTVASPGCSGEPPGAGAAAHSGMQPICKLASLRGPHPSHRRHHRPDPRQLTGTDPQLHTYTFPSLHSIQPKHKTLHTPKRDPFASLSSLSLTLRFQQTTKLLQSIHQSLATCRRSTSDFDYPRNPNLATSGHLTPAPHPPHARPYACAPSIRTLGLACTTSNPATRPPLEQATR